MEIIDPRIYIRYKYKLIEKYKMNICIKDVGKKHGSRWIFKHLNFEIKQGEPIAVIGKNGAGKSTLLKIIAGFITPTQGKTTYGKEPLEESNLSVNFVAPYIDLIEEFTLNEFLIFHSNYKKQITSFLEMANHASLPLHKPIVDFSTGMRQKAKLITSFYFQEDCVFMDEPGSNLDKEGFIWWKTSLNNILKQSYNIIASNQKEEIDQCHHIFQL